MRVVIYGAGGIGGTIGARLHLAGTDVVLIARGAHLDALRSRGLTFAAPDGVRQLTIPTVGHPAEISWSAQDVVLMTVKTQHTIDALEHLAVTAGHSVPVVCAQNGVANERMALRRFERVYGMLVNLPAIHLRPGEVVTHAAGAGGILDTGCYPLGVDRLVEELMSRIAQAGFSAQPDERVMRKKYAKLLMNLGNIVQAATVPEGGEEALQQDPEETAALKAVYGLLRAEALACFAAAGIDCAGREEVRARHENTYRMVDVPGYDRPGGSSWQSLSRGTGNVETDYLNGEISLLGSLHGVPTPANRACQSLARRMVAERLPVGSFKPSELFAMMGGDA